jgi:hypothetical protein
VEGSQQLLDLVEVQAGGWLVEDVERRAGRADSATGLVRCVMADRYRLATMGLERFEAEIMAVAACSRSS